MRILINNEPVECEAYSLNYGDEEHDMMNGILLDMENHTIFLSDMDASHREAMEHLNGEIEHFNLADCEIDWDDVPHCYVRQAIGRLIVRTAEECLE